MDPTWQSGVYRGSRGADRPFGPKASGVPRCWPGATVVCVASGPSLTRDDVERVRVAHSEGRCRVITINGRITERGCELNAPFADVLYGADATWWRAAKNAPGFRGLKVSCTPNEFRDVLVLEHRHEPGLSHDPGVLHTGGNSGYQAINLAILLGASRVLLLGYDMRHRDGKKHWHGDHPAGMTNPREGNFKGWLANFATIETDADVINCTPGSALTCFPMANLEDVL